MKSFLTFALCITVGLATPAFAKKPGKNPAQKQAAHREAIFKKLDKNNDGSISLEEFKSAEKPQKAKAKPKKKAKAKAAGKKKASKGKLKKKAKKA
jgi:EF hand